MFRTRSTHTKALAAAAALAMVVPQALGSPADIVNISAPKVGAEPPKAQAIADGDISVSTTTGAVQYSYPISVPPGRAGMQPQLALSYSSQAPTYGGIAAGWTLSGIPDIRWDGTRGLKDRERTYDRNYDLRYYNHYVSGLAGGRPLVQVTNGLSGPNVDRVFGAQNDSSYARYERMDATQPFTWRVLIPDGTIHYFGEQSRIANSNPLYTLVRAPLTRSVDPFGNTVEYFWTFNITRGEYLIDHIDYTSNPAAGLPRFATVAFTYGAPAFCTSDAYVSYVGAQEDYKLLLRMSDGASKLTQIDAIALDPGNSQVLHTRSIVLAYDPATEACGTPGSPQRHAPYRQLASITERVSGTNVIGPVAQVSLPPIEFTYGSADIGLSTTLDANWPVDEYGPNLAWGYRSTQWPSVQAMTLDLDGDGRSDRLYAAMTPDNHCAVAWKRNVTTPGGPVEFDDVPDLIQLPTLPWDGELSGDRGTGPDDLGVPYPDHPFGGELCTLNYQRTQRNHPDPNPPVGGDRGAFLPYRWIDMDSDGRLDLVTAIHSNPDTYDPNETFPQPEEPFGTWPSCTTPSPACASITTDCMSDNYRCDENGCGVGDEDQLQGCIDSATFDPCDLAFYVRQVVAPSVVDSCMSTLPPPDECNHKNPTHSSHGSIVAHKLCEQFPWEIWHNDGVDPVSGRLRLSDTPSIKLQPLPLESYSGDSSMGAGGLSSQFHAIQDIDGDGFTDIAMYAMWAAGTGGPPPYLWNVFMGDGSGGFVRFPTGRHWAKWIDTPQAATATADKGTIDANHDQTTYGIGQLGDLNGDGLTDYLFKQPGSNSIWMYPNDIWGFRQNPRHLAGPPKISETFFDATPTGWLDIGEGRIRYVEGTRTTTTRRIDLDGDHRDDLYSFVAGSPPNYVWFNTGGNFLQDAAPLGPNMLTGVRQQVSALNAGDPPLIWMSTSDLMDLDGDGQYEEVWTDGAVMHRHGRSPTAVPPRLLASIKNGRGLTTTIQYSSFSDPLVVNNDPFDSSASVPPTASSHTEWVVRSLTSCDDFVAGNAAICGPSDPSDSTTSYFYNHPFFGPDDETPARYAFRGFQEVVTTGPKGSTTTQRYDFDVDWSGRLKTTVTAEAGGAVHSISETTWEEEPALLGAITTFQPKMVRTWTCGAGVSEATCRASPAGFTNVESTWTPLTSSTVSSAPLLYAETEKTLQDSEIYNDGDRKTTTSFLLFADATNYRLRDVITEARVKASGGDSAYRHSEKKWDDSYKQVDKSTVWLDAIGTQKAITEREYDAVGNVTTIRKPVQVDANGPKLTQTYDSRKLFVIKSVDELALDALAEWDYGTGSKIWEKGSNIRTCGTSCPTGDFPERDERRTTIDALGRPVKIEVSIPYSAGTPSGQTYKYSTVETFSYVDLATATVPTSIVHKQRILHDEDRWTENDTLLDGHGRPYQITEKVNGAAPNDAVTSYSYDIDGRVIAVSVPDPTANNANRVTFTYAFDSLGRPSDMRRPDATNPTDRSGLHISYTGLIETREEVAGAATGVQAKTEFESDAFGRLTQVREYKDGTTTADTVYSFSPADEVQQIVDPEGVTTVLDHDFAGRRVAITRGARSWTYGYDKNGNMISERSPVPPGDNASLYVTSYVFDALDRVTSKLIAPRGATQGLSQADRDLFGAASITFDWDQALYNRQGRLVYFNTKDTGGNNVFHGRYFYDPEGNIIDEDRTWHAGTLTIPERGESYRWGAFGRIKSVINADGWATTEGPSTTKTIYDDRGNPQKLQLIRPALGNQYVGAQSRNVAGLVTLRETPIAGAQTMAISSSWSYDKLGRVTSQTVTAGTSQIAKQELTYSGTDDPTRLKHWIGGSNIKDFSFTFDQRHQLRHTAEAAAAFTSDYAFRSSGRFQAATVTPTALSGGEVRPRDVNYVYSASDPEEVSQLTIASGPNVGTPYATYSYDLAGNQTDRWYYTDTSLPVPQLLATQQHWTFQYDGDDQLRRATSPDGTVEEYWYDQNGQRALLRTIPSGSSTVVRWFDKNTEVQLDGTGALVKTLAYASIGTPLARIQNRNDRTELQFHGLAMGTIATVETGIGNGTGGNQPLAPGTTTSALIYSPFGEVVETSGTEASVHRRRFNDKYLDASTTLSYYGSRYFDSTEMYWTQADPLYRFSPDAAWNSPRHAGLYIFDLQNPMRYLDADGRQPAPTESQERAMRDGVPPDVVYNPYGGYGSTPAMRAVESAPEIGESATEALEDLGEYAAVGGTLLAISQIPVIGPSAAGIIAGGLMPGEGGGIVGGGCKVLGETGETPIAKVHGNSLKSTAEQQVYEITQTDATGATDTWKFGVGQGPLSENGTVPRAQRQLSGLTKQFPAIKFQARHLKTIPSGPGAREAALALEEKLVYDFMKATGFKPPGNKRP